MTSEETAISKATVPVKTEPYTSVNYHYSNPPTISKPTNSRTEEAKESRNKFFSIQWK